MALNVVFWLWVYIWKCLQSREYLSKLNRFWVPPKISPSFWNFYENNIITSWFSIFNSFSEQCKWIRFDSLETFSFVPRTHFDFYFCLLILDIWLFHWISDVCWCDCQLCFCVCLSTFDRSASDLCIDWMSDTSQFGWVILDRSIKNRMASGWMGKKIIFELFIVLKRARKVILPLLEVHWKFKKFCNYIFGFVTTFLCKFQNSHWIFIFKISMEKCVCVSPLRNEWKHTCTQTYSSEDIAFGNEWNYLHIYIVIKRGFIALQSGCWCFGPVFVLSIWFLRMENRWRPVTLFPLLTYKTR